MRSEINLTAMNITKSMNNRREEEKKMIKAEQSLTITLQQQQQKKNRKFNSNCLVREKKTLKT